MKIQSVVEEVINRWDPVHLFPSAPKDEYSLEIKEIVKYFQSSNDIKVDELAQEIKRIFNYTFGADIVIEKNEKEVANEILKKVQNQK